MALASALLAAGFGVTAGAQARAEAPVAAGVHAAQESAGAYGLRRTPRYGVGEKVVYDTNGGLRRTPRY